jgi:hypothetical protein
MITKQLTTILTTITVSGVLLALPTLVGAWSTDQSANSLCLANNTGAIRFSFTNKESNRGMKVSVKDSQTGATFSLGTVNGEQTKTGEIDTGRSILNNGTITFLLTWVSGSGSDSRTANYSGIRCVTPTPTPTNTPVPTATPTVTPMPSATPTPTATPMPSATPTVTPTNTPVPTVTPTQPTQNTNNCDDSTQVGNTNANNNCNNNNNNNSNNNTQSQNQTQNNNQNVNVTLTNQEEVLAAATTITPVPTKLPATGAPVETWVSLFGLVPVGFGIKRFASKVI